MALPRDARTFLIILEAHKGIIYKVASLYCRVQENRQDLIQEIILQLWLAFPKYEEKYKLTTWMYRIALNVSISFYRRESRRGTINQPLPDGLLYLHAEEHTGTADADVEQLYQFIRELKEIDRAVILLYLEGQSQQEMAAMLGLTETNISTKVSRIKQQLKKKFSTVK